MFMCLQTTTTDVGRAEMACKNRRTELLDVPDVWKEVAENSSSEIVVNAFVASDGTDSVTGDSRNMNR